jgi:hypothetical protein
MLSLNGDASAVGSAISLFNSVTDLIYTIILCSWYFTSEFGYMLALCSSVLALIITFSLRKVREGVILRKKINEKNS